MRLSILVALALVAACQAAGAQKLHKCAGPDGAAIFTDKPCPEAMPKHEPPPERKAPPPPKDFPIGGPRNVSPRPAGLTEDEKIDRMTTYAVILGRGIGCGVDADSALRRVTTWFGQEFPIGSPGQGGYAVVLLAGIKINAEAQREGRSPDTCATVRRTFNSFPWP